MAYMGSSVKLFFVRQKTLPHKKTRSFSSEQWKPGKYTWSFFCVCLFVFCELHALHMVCSQKHPTLWLAIFWPMSTHVPLITSVHYSYSILTTTDFLLPICCYNRVIHSFLSLSFLKKSFPPHLHLGMHILLPPPAQLWLSSLFKRFFLIYRSSHEGHKRTARHG